MQASSAESLGDCIVIEDFTGIGLVNVRLIIGSYPEPAWPQGKVLTLGERVRIGDLRRGTAYLHLTALANCVVAIVSAIQRTCRTPLPLLKELLRELLRELFREPPPGMARVARHG